MIRTLSLSRKLIALGLIGVIATAIAGVAGFRGLVQLNGAAEQLAGEVVILRNQMMADMMHDGLRGTAAIARLDAQAGKTRAESGMIEEATENGALMIAEIDSVRLNARDSLTRALATRVRPTVVRYVDLTVATAEQALSGDPTARRSAEALEQTFAELETALGELGDRVQASSAQTALRATRTSRTVRGQLLLISSVTILLVVLLARTIGSAIRTPIEQIAAHARLMAVGDFTGDVAYRSRDEIGSLADSFRELTLFVRDAADAAEGLSRGDLSRTVSPRSVNDRLSHSVNRSTDSLKRLDEEIGTLIAAAQSGRLSVRANDQGLSGAYHTLVRGINTMLDETLAPVNEATTVLDQVAQRNLRVRVAGQYRGDHARLSVALNATLDQLEGALREVYVASQEVTAAAEQIAAGSQDMADGASEQASSLEEINASLQELSSLSRDGAMEATAVRQLTESARATADAGTTRMHNLNDAMTAIQQSVTETAKIMRTIDEIAFQTNLLALNAAVEAARAGDSGRGFAVVADEVRSLALRSAEEAKRSAAVIERSLADAARGAELNQLTQTQFTEITTTIGRVTVAMQAIEDASAQQSEGIRQILAGTDQMNLVTQQAAANAEESAAAAQELTSQAESMHSMVGRFSISLDAEAREERARPSPTPRTVFTASKTASRVQPEPEFAGF